MAPRRVAALLLPALCVAFRSPGFARRLPRLPKAETATAEATPAPAEKVKLVEGFGVGIRRDVKARLPYYKSDIKDGVSVTDVRKVFDGAVRERQAPYPRPPPSPVSHDADVAVVRAQQ